MTSRNVISKTHIKLEGEGGRERENPLPKTRRSYVRCLFCYLLRYTAMSLVTTEEALLVGYVPYVLVNQISVRIVTDRLCIHS